MVFVSEKFANLELLLLPDEQLIYKVELRGGIAVTLTNRRFIMLGGGLASEYRSVFYSDIEDVCVEKRLLNLEVSICVKDHPEPISFKLKDEEKAGEICEKINNNVHTAKLGIEKITRTKIEAGAAYVSEQGAYRPYLYESRIDANMVKALERREAVLVEGQKNYDWAAYTKTNAVQLGIKGAIVGGKVLMFAGAAGNKTMSMMINRVRAGMPVIIRAIKLSGKNAILASGLQSYMNKKVNVTNLAGYTISSHQKPFAYNFRSGALIGEIALDVGKGKKQLEQDDLKIFTHRRVKAGFG